MPKYYRRVIMAKEKEMSFEENLEKLEDIVKKLENGDIPLDDAIDKFNDAMKLVKVCDERLKNAEKMVAKIVGEDGSLEDFQVEA